jgi:tartrate-resistant acid phosphatase type 5
MVPKPGVHQFISGAASERTPARMLPISKFAASDYGFMVFSATPEKILVQVVNDHGAILYTTELVR